MTRKLIAVTAVTLIFLAASASEATAARCAASPAYHAACAGPNGAVVRTGPRSIPGGDDVRTAVTRSRRAMAIP